MITYSLGMEQCIKIINPKFQIDSNDFLMILGDFPVCIVAFPVDAVVDLWDDEITCLCLLSHGIKSLELSPQGDLLDLFCCHFLPRVECFFVSLAFPQSPSPS